LLGIKHIEDVGHKFSWIIKETLEKQDDFEAYTKLLSGLRGKLPCSSGYVLKVGSRWCRFAIVTL
jgi:hypothetical protein